MTILNNILEIANDLTSEDRQETYGHPKDDFKAVGQVWTALLERNNDFQKTREITPEMIPILMAGLKLCRLAKDPRHKDSCVDTAGYMRTLEMIWERTEP